MRSSMELDEAEWLFRSEHDLDTWNRVWIRFLEESRLCPPATTSTR